ncbi:MAG: NAD-dependent epimerase/dehydratase family protein [Dictyoglomus sp.]|jgi:nucleoside-diphosphate-sugar epimerase|uniref:NAD-dependent epimerase/dehydratase family protein n=1 Tax=Dictyoglomus sp. TaxID=28205 RepID=UPI003D0A292B
MILVVGGSSFIGRGIQDLIKEKPFAKEFIFTYNKHPENIENKFQKVKLDLQDEKDCELARNFSYCIYLAGNSFHNMAYNNPIMDLDLNVRNFLNFMKHFRGQLILLSSQAVYYGLTGEIPENIIHYPTIPYGISKRFQEEYAKYFYKIGYLSKLWIFRLMYAFGKGERMDRLIPKCAKSAVNGDIVKVLGGGRSFLNPLPVNFVAEILVNALLTMKEEDNEFLEVTNLNHSEKVSVLDIVKFLHTIKPFNYIVEEKGEIWPVSFWGSTEKLSRYLKKWNISFPNIWEDLEIYFKKLLTNMGEKNYE